MMISKVDVEVRNGSSQRRYHGNMTGAHKRHAAIGHANISGDHSGIMLLSQDAVTTQPSAANPASTCGGPRCWSIANPGPFKGKVWTYLLGERIGTRP